MTLMSDPTIRRAKQADLAAIVALLADDALGRSREDPSLPSTRAMPRPSPRSKPIPINSWPSPTGRDRSSLASSSPSLPGSPGAASGGARSKACASHRARAARAWESECCNGQSGYAGSVAAGSCNLTTDKSRSDARRFYEKLGFTASHEGMKLAL
jgi:hypothetical protein